jgi:uncharacterized membrane protein YqjE
MDSLPPLYRDQREIDARHVKLLAIFHFVGAALSFGKLLLLGLHFAIFSFIFSQPEFWGPNQHAPPPKEMLAVMSIFYVIGAIFCLTSLALEVTSGYFLWHRKHRVFSMVVAVISCLSFPLGTVLGVFTLIVLMRSTVVQLYEVS